MKEVDQGTGGKRGDMRCASVTLTGEMRAVARPLAAWRGPAAATPIADRQTGKARSGKGGGRRAAERAQRSSYPGAKQSDVTGRAARGCGSLRGPTGGIAGRTARHKPADLKQPTGAGAAAGTSPETVTELRAVRALPGARMQGAGHERVICVTEIRACMTEKTEQSMVQSAAPTEEA